MTDITKDDVVNEATVDSGEESSALDASAAVSAATPALRATTSPEDEKAIKRTRTIATIVLIILIMLILAACAMMFALLRPGGLGVGNQRAGITWIRSIYGHGTAQEDLINPTSVAFDPAGNSVWVSDNARFRLVEYDLSGRLRRIFNIRDLTGEATIVSRVAFAPNGWFVVAEQTYDRVQIFDNNFELQTTLGVEHPTAVAANNDYVAVGSRRGFAVFTITGEGVGKHGADAEDEFNRFDYVSG
ncbi:MAG: hypothetical protein FWF11_01720, partial [Coriobacteriia bacterium]|nr:hypothetical protein [Coriobacteriia bacterium]